MWDNSLIGIQDIYVFPQGIHVAVKVNTLPSHWFFSAIYARNNFDTRLALWENLIEFANSIRTSPNAPWLIEGGLQ